MSTWKISKKGNLPKIKEPILIEGLPGIGNVGKLVVDFMIEELKAKKLYEILSFSFPHSVFVNEKNLIELPLIEIYHAKANKQDFIFLSGDVQPMDEESSYEFCEKILDIFEDLDGKEIITLGGIGLNDIPKHPKLYCTANSKQIVQRYKDPKLNPKIYGVVGPIIGVSGLLLGMAKSRKIQGISILAETFGHPVYLGVKGSREIIGLFNKRFKLKLNLKRFDEDIKDIEEEIIKRTEELTNVAQQTAVKKLEKKLKREISYIG